MDLHCSDGDGTELIVVSWARPCAREDASDGAGAGNGGTERTGKELAATDGLDWRAHLSNVWFFVGLRGPPMKAARAQEHVRSRGGKGVEKRLGGQEDSSLPRKRGAEAKANRTASPLSILNSK